MIVPYKLGMKTMHISTIVTILVLITSPSLSGVHAQTGMVGETGYTPNWFLKYKGDSNILSIIRGESNKDSFPNGTGYVDVVFHGYIGEKNATYPVLIKTLYKNVVKRISSIPVSILDLNNGTFIFRPHLILNYPNDTYIVQFSYGNQTVMKQYPYVFGTAGHLIWSSNYLSPLRQIMIGVPSNDVVCDVGLQLVMKIENGSPACVTHDTASKLVEQGWAKITVTKATFDVRQ